jgi:hypothetical protein
MNGAGGFLDLLDATGFNERRTAGLTPGQPCPLVLVSKFLDVRPKFGVNVST